MGLLTEREGALSNILRASDSHHIISLKNTSNEIVARYSFSGYGGRGHILRPGEKAKKVLEDTQSITIPDEFVSVIAQSSVFLNEGDALPGRDEVVHVHDNPDGWSGDIPYKVKK